MNKTQKILRLALTSWILISLFLGVSVSANAIPLCGNGVIETGESCEPPSTCICDESCHRTPCPGLGIDSACGNGILDVDDGEACDDGNIAEGDGCSPDCQRELTCTDENVCCNGITEPSNNEKCDDGNNISGDGCSPECRTEVCSVCVDGACCGDQICDDTETCSNCSADCGPCTPLPPPRVYN